MRSNRFLDYWCANMCFAWDLSHGTQWPGFRYSEAERALMRRIAERVSFGQFMAFVGFSSLLFMAVAAALVVFAMLPVLQWFWPEASRLPAAGFFGLLAATAALAIGPAMLVVLPAGAWLADTATGRQAGATDVEQAALTAKVRRQFLRMALVLGGLFVPAALLWSTLDAELRVNVLTALRSVFVASIVLSVGALVLARRSQR